MPHSLAKTTTCIDFNNDEIYYEQLRQLAKRLWNQDKSEIPSVTGGNPFKNNIANTLKDETMMLEVKYRSIEMDNTINFNIYL